MKRKEFLKKEECHIKNHQNIMIFSCTFRLIIIFYLTFNIIYIYIYIYKMYSKIKI